MNVVFLTSGNKVTAWIGNLVCSETCMLNLVSLLACRNTYKKRHNKSERNASEKQSNKNKTTKTEYEESHRERPIKTSKI